MNTDKKILQAQRAFNKQNEEYKKFCEIAGYIAQKLHDSIDKMTRKETSTQKQYDTTAYWLHQAKLLLPLQFGFRELCIIQSDHIKRISELMMETLPKIEKDLKTELP